METVANGRHRAGRDAPSSARMGRHDRVIGVFRSARDASEARRRLVQAGYTRVTAATPSVSAGRLGWLRSRAPLLARPFTRGCVLGALVATAFIVILGRTRGLPLGDGVLLVVAVAMTSALFAAATAAREQHGAIMVFARVVDAPRRDRARFILRVAGAIETCSPEAVDEPHFTSGFVEVAPALRVVWAARHRQGRAGSWAEREPNYRFGWQMANRPDFAERSWSDAQADVQTEWQRGHQWVGWPSVADEVESGWGAARATHRPPGQRT